MDTNSLPLVTFGKYKNKSVLDLIADKKYVEWLKQQSWFQNNQIYNIVVHQSLTSNTQTSNTPEHNKLQNMFLDENNQIKLFSKSLLFEKIKVNYKKLEMLFIDEDIIKCFDINTTQQFPHNLGTHSVIFEDKCNWDLALFYKTKRKRFIITSNLENELIDREKYDIEHKDLIVEHKNIIDTSNYDFHYDKHRRNYYNDIIKKYVNNYYYDYNLSRKNINQYEIEIDIPAENWVLYCELKPTLSDDYPGVLRKLKNQIALTKTPNQNLNVLLLIGNFTSTSTTREELIKIFKQSNIQIIFTNEIWKSSKLDIIKYINREDSIVDTKFVEENKTLTCDLLQTKQTLLQAEEKIKQLEYEILLLKTKKTKNSINYYFAKK